MRAAFELYEHPEFTPAEAKSSKPLLCAVAGALTLVVVSLVAVHQFTTVRWLPHIKCALSCITFGFTGTNGHDLLIDFYFGPPAPSVHITNQQNSSGDLHETRMRR